MCLDHHTCHAAAAYWGSGFAGRDALVLTNDNSGDGLCATASTGRGLALDRHEATPSAPGSVGAFYSFVTLAMGMKFGEHEYKVMGMAPYAPEKYAARAEAALREVFDLDEGRPARFRWRAQGERYQLLLRAMVGLRFDWVAGGAQRLLEDVLLRWSRLMRQRYGGGRLALGGGVFMNVKANMLLGQEDWVEELFAFPSCGDESNAVGAAYLGYVQECARRGVAAAPAAVRRRVPGPLGHRRGGGGRHPRAPPRGAVQGGLPRPDRGAHRGAPGLRRRRRPLRGADGVRGAGARQPLDPGQSLGPPRGRR